jgi:hypothetical protein
MGAPKVHYNETMPYEEVVARNRVGGLCGAITAHATPQPMVRETSNLDLVTCKNCIKQVEK